MQRISLKATFSLQDNCGNKDHMFFFRDALCWKAEDYIKGCGIALDKKHMISNVLFSLLSIVVYTQPTKVTVWHTSNDVFFEMIIFVTFQVKVYLTVTASWVWWRCTTKEPRTRMLNSELLLKYLTKRPRDILTGTRSSKNNISDRKEQFLHAKEAKSLLTLNYVPYWTA